MVKWISDATGRVTTALGRIPAILLSFLLIIVWGITGPLFGYSDTWQLVINTGTTIITFLMVFIIQNSQNRDGIAIQVKLDRIIEALDEIDNDLVGIEKLPYKDIKEIQNKVEGKK